jgi:hypothetical protein
MVSVLWNGLLCACQDGDCGASLSNCRTRLCILLCRSCAYFDICGCIPAVVCDVGASEGLEGTLW